MTVQVLLLNNGEYIISEIEEVDGDPDCVLINPKKIIELWDIEHLNSPIMNCPHVVYNEMPGSFLYLQSEKTYVFLRNFVKHTHQKQILIRSTDIRTIVEPKEEILKLYRDVVG